jgi:hypothetical protein
MNVLILCQFCLVRSFLVFVYRRSQQSLKMSLFKEIIQHERIKTSPPTDSPSNPEPELEPEPEPDPDPYQDQEKRTHFFLSKWIKIDV